MTRAAVFLDKDGTLVDDVPYNVDPDRIRLAPGAAEALRLFAAEGLRLVVVSNQPGPARARFEEEALEAVRERLEALVAAAGARLDGFYWCPHDPAGTVARYAVDCACRKPKDGLLRRASRELSLDPAASWMIGDTLDDVEAGHRAGCRAILVDSGGETEWHLWGPRRPDGIAADLADAARAALSARAEEVPWARR